MRELEGGVTIPPGYFGTEEQRGRRVGHVTCNDARGVRNSWSRQIGGLTVATVITLILVPVFYSIAVRDMKIIKWEAGVH